MDKNWKVVRNRACIKALLIFLGIILMQMLAYMLCAAGMGIQAVVTGQDGRMLIEKLAGAQNDGDFLILVSLVSAFLSMIWCGVLYNRSDWREKPFDYRKAFSPKNCLAVVGIGVGGCVLITILLSLLALVIPQAFSSYNTVMDNLTDNSMGITLLYVLLVGPVSEELIFRGAVLDRFYLAFPFWFANILQAALFGLYHMNLIQGIYAFCLGAVLGMIRRMTGSIIASVITHILFNSTSYGMEFLFPQNGDIELWEMAGLILAGAVICFLSLRYILKSVSEW